MVHCLQAMQEHRSVLLLEDGAPHLDHVIWANREEVPIERGVVELAQRQPVRNERLALRQGVPRDMGSVEELLVPETAEGAPHPIGLEHARAKRARETPAGGACDAQPL